MKFGKFQPGLVAALMALGIAGCAGSVLTPDGRAGGGEGHRGQETATGGGQGTSAGGAGGDVGQAGGCAGELAPVVSFDAPSSGAFVGGTLHVHARLGGDEARYHVLKIAGGEGFVVSTLPAMGSPARLSRVWDPSLYARLRVEGEAAFVDLVDASDPTAPLVQESRTVPGIVPEAWQDTMAIVSAHALVCVSPAPGEDPVLTSIPVFAEEGAKPVAPTPSFDQPCHGWAHAGGAALGTSWVTWGAESDLIVYGVTVDASAHLADYYYNPDGIHQYGNVLSAAMDGSRIVFDPSNDSEFFLYAVGSGLPYTTHAYLGISGPKRLLAVVDQVAYLATAKAVRAYDVSDVNAVKLLDYHADADFGAGLATLIASDEDRLAVTDDKGRLWVIPLGSSGPVKPLTVHDGPLPSGCGG
jgi:hypothetical protein